MSDAREPPRLVFYGWRSPAVIGVALVAVAAGFGQFGPTAALGDVAKGFGHVVSGTTIRDEAGLSGTELGLGLAVLRLASLGALPITVLADRLGRRRVLLVSCGIGLALTVAAAASPGYWWFVAIFALGRPLLSASSAVGQVIVSELTDAANRAKAVALVTGGYGLGAGITALLHGSASGALGFRGLFLAAALPLASLPLLGRLVLEPGRFLAARDQERDAAGVGQSSAARLGRVHRALRPRLVLVMAIAFGVALTSGPATSFVFLDAENIAKLGSLAVSAMVLGAGVLGAVGLYLGQAAADRFGRRPSGIVAMIAIAGFSVLTYSGPHLALVGGYVLGVFAASLFAPTAGSFVNELFPTEVRAAVSGWLVVASVLGAVVGLVGFGAIADAGASLGVAAAVTFSPTVLLAFIFLALPESRGLEPEAAALAVRGLGGPAV